MMKWDDRSYYEILSEIAAQHPDREAIVTNNKRLTFSDLIRRIDQIASALRRRGFHAGDRAALWSASDADFICAYLGIIRAGGAAVLLNSNLKEKDAAPLAAFAECRFLIFGKTHDTNGTFEETEPAAASMHIDISHVFLIDDPAFDAEPEIVPDMNGTGNKDDAHIIFTSGTTAFPKAVLTSQFSVISILCGISEALSDILSEKALIAVPLFHIFGVDGMMLYLLRGGCVVLPDRVKAADVAQMVMREKTPDIWSVALIFQALIDDEDLAQSVAPIAKMCLTGGSFITPAQFLHFEATLVNATFINGYGMSETSGGYVFVRADDPLEIRYNTVGRITAERFELAIWDEQKGFLPSGEIGEILTRGPHLKNCYLKLPPEEQAIDRDGWLHSGDLGVLDDAGNLKIVGRRKDLVIKGGENISPSEIESALSAVNGISACRVFGYFDRVWGENLAACVIMKDGAVFREEAIQEEVKAVVGSFKTPVYVFEYRTFPYGASGKIDQSSLHADMLNRLKRRVINSRLPDGVRVTTLTMLNSTYCIMPVVAMVERYAISFGYDRKRAMQICLCAEEMLTMRVDERDPMLDTIEVRIDCFSMGMQIATVDEGMSDDDIMKEIRTKSAAIIARFSDDISMDRLEDGRFITQCRFLYDKSFNIEEFLMLH